jgi:hypothetical protein
MTVFAQLDLDYVILKRQKQWLIGVKQQDKKASRIEGEIDMIRQHVIT